jgi:hypothetical protein
MRSTFWLMMFMALVVVTLFGTPARADYQVFVGYADGLRGGGFFPNPWSGDPGVTFIGTGSPFDAGAIRIDNTGATNVVVSDVSVVINGTFVGDIWGLPGSPVTLAPGGELILTQTGFFNFDTSDMNHVAGAGPGSPCIGAASDPAQCAVVFPTVSVTTGAGAQVFDDTGHVLDTEGFDFASVGNESHAWRPIGTFGGQPGGNVPEPSGIVLLGTSLLACLSLVRGKLQKQQQ